MPSTSSHSRASIPGARIVDFHTAELSQQGDENFLQLQVEGLLPMGDVDVRLAPRFYSDRPDYWAIEVVAVPSASNAARGDGKSFICVLRLTDIIGFRGITVVGANRVQRIDVAPCSARQDAST
jgi:hypothetical protein